MHPTQNAAVQVRLSGPEFVSLENWRKAQEKIPPRSEAIREAIRRLVRPADDLAVVPAPYDNIPTNTIQRRPKAYGPVASRTVHAPADPIGETAGSKDAASANTPRGKYPQA